MIKKLQIFRHLMGNWGCVLEKSRRRGAWFMEEEHVFPQTLLNS